MTTEQNKAIARRFIEEIFVAGRPDAVDELLADDPSYLGLDRGGQG